MTPLEIAQDVIAVARAIYDQAQLVQSNKERWKNLVDVIKQMTSSLQGLNDLPDTENFKMSLEKLQTKMREIAEFLNKMCQLSYIMRFALAGRHQSELESYRQDLYDLIPLLQLGLSVQPLIDREKDRRAEFLDRQAFIREQEELLEKRQAEFFKEKHELAIVMEKQMDAFREQLEKNWQPTPSADKSPLPEQYLVHLYDVTFQEKLKTSRTGDIYRAIWKRQSVLVKFIEGAIPEADRQQFIREAQIMSRLHNEHIVPFYGACFENRRMCIVMGFIDKSLSTMLHELTWDARLAMAKDLVSGLQYLHQQRPSVIHNDIHPDNIGVTKYGEAKWMDISWVKTELSSMASLGIAHDVSCWQAPEIWGDRQQVTPESDVYSIGWLLWSLYMGELPPSLTPSQRLTKVVADEIEQRSLKILAEDCPKKYRELIEACWRKDPRQRPALSEILRTLYQPLTTPRAASPTGEAYYEQGKKAEQAGDLSAALESYHRSADKNYYKSFNSLGTFALGKGGQRKDPARAAEYFKQGAEAGHAPAMFNLGRMYEKGDTDTRTIDLNKALFWYEKAREADREETRYDDKITTLTATLRQSGLRK